jgi:hypothetical protein
VPENVLASDDAAHTGETTQRREADRGVVRGLEAPAPPIRGGDRTALSSRARLRYGAALFARYWRSATRTATMDGR